MDMPLILLVLFCLIFFCFCLFAPYKIFTRNTSFTHSQLRFNQISTSRSPILPEAIPPSYEDSIENVSPPPPYHNQTANISNLSIS